MIEVTETGFTVHFEGSKSIIEEIALLRALKTQLAAWNPAKDASCSVVVDALKKSTALKLNEIFAGPLTQDSKFQSVAFSFQFKQILNKALTPFFFRRYDMFRFPESTRFICASSTALDEWVQAIDIAVKNKRLSENSLFDLSAGMLPEGKQSSDDLFDALSNLDAPDNLQVIYQGQQGAPIFLNSDQLKAKEEYSGVVLKMTPVTPFYGNYKDLFFPRQELPKIAEEDERRAALNN